MNTRQANVLGNGLMFACSGGLVALAVISYVQWGRPWAALLLVGVAVVIAAGKLVCGQWLAYASSDASRMRRIIDNLPESLFVKDREGRFVLVNRRMAELFRSSPEALIGKSEMDVATGFQGDQNGAAADAGSAAQRQTVCLRCGSSPDTSNPARWFQMVKTPLVDETGNGGEVLGLAVDITDRKEAEWKNVVRCEEQELAKRREAIGLMAAGVAHDLNNMLSPAVAYVDIALDHLDDRAQVREDLVAVRESAQRSARLVNDLLTLARCEPVPGRPVRINDVVLDFVDSPTFHDLQSRRPNVTVHCNVDETNPCVVGTASCLNHIVLNMVVNAMEAMPASGAMTLKTLVDEAPPPAFRKVHGDGPCVQVMVQDTGKGFDEAHLPRIFEPYYATHAAGGCGSGLSLAVVRSMVLALNGHVELASSPAGGTTLRLFLPLTAAHADEAAEPRERQIRTNSILVVDDDELLCTLTIRILESLGFDCEVAEDGREAMEIYRNGDFDLVILDMVMKSGFDGLDTYDAIRELCPDQPCVIVSAFSEGARSHEALAKGAKAFLQKPFSPAALRRTVSEVLGIPENELG